MADESTKTLSTTQRYGLSASLELDGGHFALGRQRGVRFGEVFHLHPARCAALRSSASVLPRRPGSRPARDRPPAASRSSDRRPRLPGGAACRDSPPASARPWPRRKASDHPTTEPLFHSATAGAGPDWRAPRARADRRAPAASTYRFRALLRRPCACVRRLPNRAAASSTSSRWRCMRARSPGVVAACSADFQACAACG